VTGHIISHRYEMGIGVKSKSEIYKEGDNKGKKYKIFQRIKIFGEVNKKESEDEITEAILSLL
tara:strand:- start:1645 stop:1833 length:189 start_codon:yes stop_codon:yes gene_type:complete